ncbi:peroxiredoxin [Flagelloscypha sp. PMI_526]|nr:peroxiredoxin [Flagelloscypha sp. PMI_526]
MATARVRHPAPDFTAATVVDGVFEDVTLSALTKAGKWVVLLFYPMDFTFEILAFNDTVSTDSKYSHYAWASSPRKTGGLGPDLKLALVEDKNMKISRDYGCLVEEEGIALRGLYIIDPKGILRSYLINDTPVGRSVDETLRVIEAFQFYEENGEVCPANWKKGGKTINADPKKSLEYFSSVNAETNGASTPNGEPSAKRQRTD